VKEMETANDGMKLKAKEINEWMNEWTNGGRREVSFI
jgi:hypothetical protein